MTCRTIKANTAPQSVVIAACQVKAEAPEEAEKQDTAKSEEKAVRSNRKKVRIIDRVFDQIIRAMGEMIEVRDPYTSGHQRRVAQISVEIAKLMALPDNQIKGIQMAAQVHDIGKLAIPSDILSKPGKLNQMEFGLIKTHSSIGYDILKEIEFPWPLADIVLQHHERINGSGYPAGLQRDQISLESRIISVADVIEAMSSNRPYRPAIGIELAIEEISEKRGLLYDSNVVEACLSLFNEKSYWIPER